MWKLSPEHKSSGYTISELIQTLSLPLPSPCPLCLAFSVENVNSSSLTALGLWRCYTVVSCVVLNATVKYSSSLGIINKLTGLDNFSVQGFPQGEFWSPSNGFVTRESAESLCANLTGNILIWDHSKNLKLGLEEESIRHQPWVPAVPLC